MLNSRTFKFAGLLVIVVCIIAMCYGCGASSDSIGGSGTAGGNYAASVVDVAGRVSLPANMQASKRQNIVMSLVSVTGTRVYVEDNINLWGEADSDGNYIIRNVPVGNHRFVARISPVPGEVYLYRTAPVAVQSASNLPIATKEPVQITEVLYPQKAENYVTINVIDMETGSPVSYAEVLVWGDKQTTDENGVVKVGPLPECASESVVISKAGYRTLKTYFDFDARNNSEITLKLVKNSQTYVNNAPVASILCDFEYNNGLPSLRKNTRVLLEAKVNDPDGDTCEINWTASVGSLSSQIGNTVSYYTPDYDCKVLITLTAKDSRGAEGTALLKALVGYDENATYTYPVSTGTVPIATATPPVATGTQPVATATYPLATGTSNLYRQPADNSVFTGVATVTVSWEGMFPGAGNNISYVVYYGEKVSSLRYNWKYLQTSSCREMLGNLSYNKTYYWKVVAYDNGVKRESDIWSFTLKQNANRIPVISNLSPADGSLGVSPRPVFEWSVNDPDGDNVFCDLYLSKTASFTDNDILCASLTSPIWQTISDLDYETQYYWQVVARDPWGGIGYSGTHSFFVASSGIDLVPPTLMSVSPINGAENVEVSNRISLVFSERINYDNEAFIFRPAAVGQWIQASDGNLTFTHINFVPGCRYDLIINHSKISDVKGNIMASGTTTISFTTRSDVPIPANYVGSGFPVDLPAGASLTIELTGLPSNGKIYAMAVSETQATSNIISYSLTPAEDFNSRLRTKEKLITGSQYNNKNDNPELLKSVSRNIGDERSFWIRNTNSDTPNSFNCTLKAISNNYLVYLENTTSGLASDSSYYDDVISQFETMYSSLTNAFGNFPETGPDGESRISVVLTDNLPSGIGGYFYGLDLSNDSHSNQCKVVFMRAYSRIGDILGTAAHELQHMINFNNRMVNNGESETWLNEGLSCYAEDLVGRGLATGDYGHIYRLFDSQANISNLSLTEWTGSEQSYGLSYMFVKFLSSNNRYGSESNVVKTLASNVGTIKSRIENITGESFYTTLGRWGMAMYINDYSNSSANAYGIKDVNLKGIYGGVRLNGFTYKYIGGDLNMLKDGVIGLMAQADINGRVTMSINANSKLKVFLYYEKH